LLVVGPWVLTIALFMTVTGLAVGAALIPEFGMDVGTAGFLFLASFWALIQSSVGTAIAWHRPENRIGRLMQLTGPLIVSVFAGFLVGALRYLTHGPTDVPGGFAAWWGSVAILPVIFLAFPSLTLLFPDGRLPTPAFRLPLQAIVTILVLVTVTYAGASNQLNEGLPDNPFGAFEVGPDFAALVGLAGTLALVAGIALAIAGFVIRWRRGSVGERAQLKWLLAPLALGVGSFGYSFGSSLTDVADLVSFISTILVPLSIGIAVLRYRLYEIDRVISRTLSWGLVTAVVAAVFLAAVATLQGVLAGITQGQTLSVATSTLVAAALFQPVRRRIQALVDRRFDRARYDAQRTADRFAERVRSEVDLLAVRAGLATVAIETVRPTGAWVWLRSGSPGEASER
jgi:hypothetical protein